MGVGPDLDNKVSLLSSSKDNEGSDDGESNIAANRFSTISLKGSNDACEVSGPAGFKMWRG